jgi:putative heme-binding domain-containing protein
VNVSPVGFVIPSMTFVLARGRYIRSVAVALILNTVMGGGLSAREIDDKTRVALEALDRLKGVDLEANASLKTAVLRILEKTRGEPEFVGLVRAFKLGGEDEALADYAARNPGNAAAIDALRYLLESNRVGSIEKRLGGADADAAATAKVLGMTGDGRMVPLLLPLVTGATRSLPVRRAAAGSLARVIDGSKALLAVAAGKKLPDDLNFVVGAELRNSRWPEIRKAAEPLFPPPATKGNVKLPPVQELIKMSGDAVRGAVIFRRQDVGCINCHQINGEGVDFGPKLSEIGTKLGKDALCESILDPSSGIAFGYEAWNLQLKNGDEVFGLISSETEDDLVVKIPGGVLAKYKKSDVAKREKQALSIMPAGLQENMTVTEFVDLIEYLSSLKKANP